jgi:Putative adhesin Stv domain
MGLVMIIGHGGWDLSDPPYAQVPRDTTIYFYAESGTSWVGANMELALTLSDAFKNAEANQEGKAYSSVPNYTLSPLDAETRTQLEGLDPGGYVSVYVDADTKLCTDTDGSLCGSGIHACGGLFADPRVVGNDCYWMACRVIELSAVPADETPVAPEERINLAQFAMGARPAGSPDQLDAEMLTELYDAFAAGAHEEQRDAWNDLEDDWKRMLLTDQRFAALFPDG